ncbi:S-adenosyl-L-methionine-dependent methyltransferase [Cryphonectria parasitica EP155]|uniref:S-adenosyl-L-methionine-dependent methyltransferase n=1 Tax=Cryphonectria parasitica (strain ATCC 38755 / EP155) TaxID=660469 RepID=A0A9P4YDE5_CRYP1|nr:S-adenosyl-L-methionine-dependent methyltransferase [Cryphonectria parasitica EP155]KAF3770996.1 S-adenosyl-L-methionine-dependent methyltransferase [Cryphonectria parasitica EP155]
MSAQNMYDNPEFFQKYSEFPRAIKGSQGASEWPELQAMLPSDLNSKKVLDLACGEGWFSRWCISRGAREVDACDISVNMLRKAESRTRTIKGFEQGLINFSRTDLEKLVLRTGAYDLVFCGLALHYVKNIENVIREVHASLIPGGLFVFSIEHPFLTAPTRPGFTKTPDGEVDQWPVDSYFDEGERSINWLVQDVKKQHRTLSSYFALLVGAGFEVVQMEEWGATEQKTRKHPDWIEGVCPRFLLMTARKRGEKVKITCRRG